MRTAPTVSVVLPTYNGALFLADTLRAVLAQTQPDIELIVVDDGSTDESLELAARIAPAAQRLRQTNAGVSAARNHGLAQAQGQYVIFLDQDDVWHPSMLERQVAWLDGHPDHDVVSCPYQHWHPDAGGGYRSAEQSWPPTREDADPRFTGWVYHQFLLDCWALTSGTLMRRAVVSSVGGFDKSLPYSEDWDLWIRLSQRSRFALLNWPPVLYRQHPVQGSRKPRARDFRCELLERSARTYGLASRDGRTLTRREFRQQMARYRFEFGYHHLHAGSRLIGIRSMLAAWARRPGDWKPLALAAAAGFGWRPRP